MTAQTPYHRELSHARRDARELDMLLAVDALTDRQLAQAIGLAFTAHAALLRAFGALWTDPQS